MNWVTVLAIDFDRHACATYAANFPGVEVRCASVADEIKCLPYADICMGGPPCTPHSLAGKRQASGDARDCGPDFAAAVAKVKPRHFLMENVPGLLSSEGGRYWQRLYAMLEGAGYVVDYRVQDAVSFGAPQFRERLWVWGIRCDLYVDGIRHCWPKPTHAWPPPAPCMFGAELLPAVTVGEALALDGLIQRGQSGNGYIERHGDREPSPATKPSPTLGDGDNGSNRLFIQSHADPARQVNEPSATLRSGGGGHDGCCVRLHAYRWSDAMLLKHPPASPASPAPTVLGKFFKGGAEGLVAAGPWKQKGELLVRRLSVWECARLQSMPDDFRWPEGIAKTNAYRIIGNGWSAIHAAALSRAFAAADPDARTIIDLYCGGSLGACGWHGRAWEYTPAEMEASC